MRAHFPPQRPKKRRKVSNGAMLLLAALLLLPVLAGVRLARSWDARFAGGYLLLVSGVTVWMYWHDKRRAERGGWRTPESTLHFAGLLGGWPAAFLAQRAFRHKTAKASFQAAFWGIVALHQAAAFDYLHDWHYSRAVLLLFRS